MLVILCTPQCCCVTIPILRVMIVILRTPQCCGVTGPSDWHDSPAWPGKPWVPHSCCRGRNKREGEGGRNLRAGEDAKAGGEVRAGRGGEGEEGLVKAGTDMRAGGVVRAGGEVTGGEGGRVVSVRWNVKAVE